jgi:hypothetical protein
MFAVPPVPVVEHEVHLSRACDLSFHELLIHSEQLHDARPLTAYPQRIELPDL